MFYTTNPFMPISAASKLSFSTILSNAGKALNVVNQALPLVYQMKPLVNNAKTFFKVAKEFNSTNTNTINTKNLNNSYSYYQNNINNNAPKFFI